MWTCKYNEVKQMQIRQQIYKIDVGKFVGWYGGNACSNSEVGFVDSKIGVVYSIT
jgi:hypothetical protein